MAEKLILNATKREASGSGAAKRLRRSGSVPGVIYGSEQDNYSIQLKQKDFTNLLHNSTSENVLITLCIEGAKEAEKLAMIQAVQHNALTGAVEHVDFHAVREDEDLTAGVPVELIGEPEGVKKGGMLDHQVHTVEVRCRPADLPTLIELDVSDLEIGQAKHASDLGLPEGVVLSTDGDVVVASVQEVKELVVEEAEPETPIIEGEEAPAEDGEAAAAEGEKDSGGEK